MMRVHPARIDDAGTRVDHSFIGARLEIRRDGLDPAIANAQIDLAEPGAFAAAFRSSPRQGS